MDMQAPEVSQRLARNHEMPMHDCIQLCLRCHQESTEALQYCIQRGGDHTDPHLLKMLQTCIEITNSAARFMMLQSSYHSVLCELCAQICLACAKSCQELSDDAMLDCERACIECAESCMSMVPQA